MSKLFNAFFAVLFGLLLGVADAEAAKRMGGGRSVGTHEREPGTNMFWSGMRSHLTRVSA